jgi:hypothetical protein
MAEPTGPGTAAPVPHAGPNAPRDASHWAAKVDRARGRQPLDARNAHSLNTRLSTGLP